MNAILVVDNFKLAMEEGQVGSQRAPAMQRLPPLTGTLIRAPGEQGGAQALEEMFYHMERFAGIVVCIVTSPLKLSQAMHRLDSELVRRFKVSSSL